MYPFTEIKSDNHYIRTFNSEVDTDELKWHWDEEDRVIESIEETNWMFQFDNKLPQRIEGKIFIQKGEWHRLIKGDKDLKLKLYKL